MSDKKPTYIEGVGWRYEPEHSRSRRLQEHDYQSRCIYMLTLCVAGRKPLLGELRWTAPDGSDAAVVPTELGREVESCWLQITHYHPEVVLLSFQLMPDHVHGVLFVTRGTEAHLGKVVNGFKIGCNQAYRRLFPLQASPVQPLPSPVHPLPSSSLEALPQGLPPTGSQPRPKHPQHGMLFEPGYVDTVLRGRNQLEHMLRYVAANPSRLAVKRLHPDLFRVVGKLTVGAQTFAAVGNRWLLDRPVRLQVRCHRASTPENVRLVALQKAYCLQRSSEGAVLVSPCISAGEKEIARAALDAGRPLIVIFDNGFPPLYKPPGRYFDACAAGRLLMLAPWPYHAEHRAITRSQCLALNQMAHDLSTEPWTPQLEATLK